MITHEKIIIFIDFIEKILLKNGCHTQSMCVVAGVEINILRIYIFDYLLFCELTSKLNIFIIYSHCFYNKTL